MSRKKLGKYEIIERIGRGGMAEVYRGYHASLDRYVAIKMLHPFLADDPEFKDRFENEARNVARLKHPNIVQVYDFDYDGEGESYYMVMELINGPTLKDRLFDLGSTGARFPTAESIRIIKSAAEALAYAHQRGMIHRDVKPANLMLDEDGRVVLTDFGIAKIVSSAQFTASGGMVGTPAYMAPEQGLGEAGDERSDIYSLGVILYQLISGRLPFDADTPLAIILKHVNDILPAPSQFFPGLPEDLEKIACKVLEKEPEDRFPTAIQFAQELGLLDESGRRRPMVDPVTGLIIDSIPSPFDTRPDPLSGTQRATLMAAAEKAGLTDITPVTHLTPPGKEGEVVLAQAGAPGRLRPVTVFGFSAVLIGLILIALFGFGSDQTPLSALFGEEDTATPQPSATEIAAQITASPTPLGDEVLPVKPPTSTRQATRTAQPGSRTTLTATVRPLTNTPAQSATPSPSATKTYTPAPTNTPTLTPTLTLTPTPTATFTPSPTPTLTYTPSTTPTPDLTGTALANFFATQAAASPTPNMTQTLAVCDFQHIVVLPERYDRPPDPQDSGSPRLIPAGQEFTFEVVLENVGNCDWPSGARLSYNEELTQNPDESVNLSAIENECTTDLRPGLNFARQEQPNFYLNSPVRITEQSAPIIFTGTAPPTFGCYYGVWDMLYPNSSVPLGRPLVLTIRVWGGG
ncbi:MAG: serine/threonine protein kinase [Chloroflexi bacterium]|nr:serine/threonine protein kinase [Chloroflexota bacterium]